MSNFNLTYQKDGENEQLYYKDAHNNDLYIRSCEDFAPAIIQEKSGNPIAITDGADCPIRKLKIIFEPIQDGSGDPSPDNVRPISGRQSVTVTRTGKNIADDGHSVTVQLGQTVYGGAVDVTGGTSEDGWNYVTFDGTERCTAYSEVIVVNKAFTVGAGNQYIKCNYASGIAFATNAMNSFQFPKSVFGVDTADEFKALLASYYASGNPLAVCYKLATPTEIITDPATLSTLKGENTFSTDGTSIELEYVVDTKTYIDNLFNSGTKTVVKPNDEIKIIDENKGVE